ncbi:MAG: LPS export ABC transporter periplasmic protein LptC [Burkholderiaceae bacterium]
MAFAVARSWRAAFERLTIYLPMLLMGLLALASYWLLQATPGTPTPGPDRAEVHQPHHVMQGFSVRTHGPGGALKTEVLGSEARLFPDDGSMEMDDPRVRSFSTDGVLTTLAANQGWSNKANDEFVLRGNAQVVRHPAALATGQKLGRMEFQGQHLRVFTAQHRVVSDEPVLLLRGADRITANRLDYNDEQRVAVLTGRVRAQLVARPQP